MPIREVIYYIVMFLLSLLIQSVALFAASRVVKPQKSSTFNKAFNVILRVFLTLLVIGALGWLALFLLAKIGLASSLITWIVYVAVLVISIIYYVKLVSSRYGLGVLGGIILIVLMWVINLGLLYLIDMLIVIPNVPSLMDLLPQF